jgi:hypothetical protein
MMSAGEIKASRVVSDQLCGRAYLEEQDEAGRRLRACEKKVADGYQKIVEAAEMDDAEKKVFDGSLRDASGKAAEACFAETKYSGGAADAQRRRKMIACTSAHIAGGKFFDFDAKRGLTYEKLLRHLADRSKGEVAIAADDVEIPGELQKGIAGARRIEGGFFSEEAEELFRGAMLRLEEEKRAAAAEAVAQRVIERMHEAFESYRTEEELGKRVALKEKLSRTFIAGVTDDGAKLQLAEMPAALLDPARLGLKGPVTASLKKELRRLFTEAWAHEQRRTVLPVATEDGGSGAKRLSAEALADLLLKALSSDANRNSEKLAAALRRLQVKEIEVSGKMDDVTRDDVGPTKTTMTVVLEKRRAGRDERRREALQKNLFRLKLKDVPNPFETAGESDDPDPGMRVGNSPAAKGQKPEPPPAAQPKDGKKPAPGGEESAGVPLRDPT